jgi:hypothetical protein
MLLIKAAYFLTMTIQDSKLASKQKEKSLLKAIVLMGLALFLVTVFVSILFIPRESPSPNFSPSNSQTLPNSTISPVVTSSFFTNNQINTLKINMITVVTLFN